MDLAVMKEWIFGQSERNKKVELRENAGGCPVDLSCKNGGWLNGPCCYEKVDFWVRGNAPKEGNSVRTREGAPWDFLSNRRAVS